MSRSPVSLSLRQGVNLSTNNIFVLVIQPLGRLCSSPHISSTRPLSTLFNSPKPLSIHITTPYQPPITNPSNLINAHHPLNALWMFSFNFAALFIHDGGFILPHSRHLRVADMRTVYRAAIHTFNQVWRAAAR